MVDFGSWFENTIHHGGKGSSKRRSSRDSWSVRWQSHCTHSHVRWWSHWTTPYTNAQQVSHTSLVYTCAISFLYLSHAFKRILFIGWLRSKFNTIHWQELWSHHSFLELSVFTLEFGVSPSYCVGLACRGRHKRDMEGTALVSAIHILDSSESLCIPYVWLQCGCE